MTVTHLNQSVAPLDKAYPHIQQLPVSFDEPTEPGRNPTSRERTKPRPDRGRGKAIGGWSNEASRCEEDPGGRIGERRERDWQPDERRDGEFRGRRGKEERGRRKKRKAFAHQLRGSRKRRAHRAGWLWIPGGIPRRIGEGEGEGEGERERETNNKR